MINGAAGTRRVSTRPTVCETHTVTLYLPGGMSAAFTARSGELDAQRSKRGMQGRHVVLPLRLLARPPWFTPALDRSLLASNSIPTPASWLILQTGPLSTSWLSSMALAYQPPAAWAPALPVAPRC